MDFKRTARAALAWASNQIAARCVVRDVMRNAQRGPRSPEKVANRDPLRCAPYDGGSLRQIDFAVKMFLSCDSSSLFGASLQGGFPASRRSFSEPIYDYR